MEFGNQRQARSEAQAQGAPFSAPERAPSDKTQEPCDLGTAAWELPLDMRVVVLTGYTYRWRITSEVLPMTWRQVDLEA
jgi:hypothetical protein